MGKDKVWTHCYNVFPIKKSLRTPSLPPPIPHARSRTWKKTKTAPYVVQLPNHLGIGCPPAYWDITLVFGGLMPDLHIHVVGEWKNRAKERERRERASDQNVATEFPNPLSEAKPDVEDHRKYRGLIPATAAASMPSPSAAGRGRARERDGKRDWRTNLELCVVWYLRFRRQFWDVGFFLLVLCNKANVWWRIWEFKSLIFCRDIRFGRIIACFDIFSLAKGLRRHGFGLCLNSRRWDVWKLKTVFKKWRIL